MKPVGLTLKRSPKKRPLFNSFMPQVLADGSLAPPMEKASFRGSGLSPQQFFAQIETLFAGAALKTSPLERCYHIADHEFRLQFANVVLAEKIAPALEHNCVDNVGNDALTVQIWDSVGSETPMPDTPWDNTEYSIRNEIRGWSDARFRTTFHMGSGVLTLLDLEQRRAIWWIRDANELPYYESGAPFLTLFHAWMSTRSSRPRRLMHAAAIGNQSGGVLIVGRSGSGKSSTALQTFNSNLLYTGDDYCLVSDDDGTFRAHSLYSSGKVHGEDARFFPHLRASLSNENSMMTEKALYFFAEKWHNKLGDQFPIRAVLLPRVNHEGAPKLTDRKSVV